MHFPKAVVSLQASVVDLAKHGHQVMSYLVLQSQISYDLACLLSLTF